MKYLRYALTFPFNLLNLLVATWLCVQTPTLLLTLRMHRVGKAWRELRSFPTVLSNQNISQKQCVGLLVSTMKHCILTSYIWMGIQYRQYRIFLKKRIRQWVTATVCRQSCRDSATLLRGSVITSYDEEESQLEKSWFLCEFNQLKKWQLPLLRSSQLVQTELYGLLFICSLFCFVSFF